MSNPAIEVLLIEDNPGDVKLVRAYLSEDPEVRIDVEHARRLSTGLTRLSESPVDVVLLDLGLPDSIGLETFRRAFEHSPTVPIVILTGAEVMEQGLQAVREGAADYLPKNRMDGPLLIRSIRFAIERAGRRRAAQELKEEKGFLETVLESLGHPFYVINVDDYRVIQANSAAGFGELSQDSTCHALVHKAPEPCSGRLLCPLEEVKRTKRPTVIEHLHFDKDDNDWKAQVHAYPIFDSARNVSQVIVYAIDVTDRDRAEAALCASEERFRVLVETTSDWIWEVDQNGVYKYSSPKVEELLGYAPDEIVGKTLFDLVDPEEAQHLAASFRRSMESGEPLVRLEHTNLGKDGGRVVLETNAMPVLNREGRVLGYRGIDRDITAAKEAQQSLRERERRYHQLLSAVTSYTYTVYFDDGKPVKTEHGEGCLAVTGYRPLDYARDPYLWLRMVHRDDMETVKRHVDKVHACEVVPAIEHRIIHKNGSTRWVSLAIVPHCENSGRLVRYDGVIEDITERKQAQLALRDKEVQLLAAQEIQQRFLPRKAPKIPGFDIAGALRPAEYAAGDFFDFLPMRDDAIGLVLGDVSGHGFGPALIMASTHVLLRLLVEVRTDVGEILNAANTVLVDEIEEDRFVTLLFAHLDPQTGSLVYANAGHPPGYVLDPSGAIRVELESTGFPLGILPDAEYSAAEPVALAPGETVLLLSDGILESPSPDGAQFGPRRALETVRANRNRTASQIVKSLCQAARDFSQGEAQLDDTTAVVIKVDPLRPGRQGRRAHRHSAATK
jgi:PAS domain S-box-containing protein